MKQRPQARIEGIVTERVGDELVMYDQSSHMGHSLSPVAASVWERCDGQRSPEEIGIELALEPTLVERALHELSGCGLLDDDPTAERGYSRREATVRFAKVGAAAFSAPLIYSVAIRPASAAASVAVCSSNCAQGTIIACGTSTGQCNATPGSTASSSACSNSPASLCYRGASNNTCYCATFSGNCCAGSGGGCPAPPPYCQACCGACVGGTCT